MKRLLTSIGILSVTLALWAQHDERELADPVPCNKEAWQSVKNVTLAWGSIDVRYSRSEVPVLTPVKRMSVHGWRGERLNVQAVLTTPKAIKQVKLDMSDLKSGRNLIPASSVNKYFVCYTLSDKDSERKDSILVADRLLYGLAHISHSEPGISVCSGDGNDGGYGLLPVLVQVALNLGCKLFRDIDDTITVFGHTADGVDSLLCVVAGEYFKANGGKAVDTVLVANHCDLIHRALSPSPS